MIKGFKIMIYPTKEQSGKIIKFCNASRYIYNWALSLEEENYNNGNKFISGYELTKLLTKFKKQEGNEWLKEISGRALKVSVMNLANSYEVFLKENQNIQNINLRNIVKCHVLHMKELL